MFSDRTSATSHNYVSSKNMPCAPEFFLESSTFHESIEILRSATAKSLASATSVPEVLLRTSVSDVLHILEKDGISCIVVRDFNTTNDSRDAVLRRIDIFNAAINLTSTRIPLSCIVEQLPHVQQLDGEKSLLDIVQVMQTTGCEEVGVIDREHNVVRGVVTCKGLLSFIRRHERAHEEKHRDEGLGIWVEEDNNEEGDQLMTRTSKENRTRQLQGQGRFTQSQLVAQVLPLKGIP